MNTAIAIYVSILQAAIASSDPAVCRDRLELAVQAAPTFVSPYWSSKKASQEAQAVVKANARCDGTIMFVSK